MTPHPRWGLNTVVRSTCCCLVARQPSSVPCLVHTHTLFSSMQARSCSPLGHSMTIGSLGASAVINFTVTAGSSAAVDLTLLNGLCWTLEAR